MSEFQDKMPVLYGFGCVPTDLETGQVVNKEDPEVARMLEHNNQALEHILELK